MKNDRITQLKAEIAKQEKLLHIAINSGNKYDTYDEYEIAIAPFQARIRTLERELRTIMPYKLMDKVDDDDVMTIKEFISAVKSGLFIDYDGYGRYVKDGKKTNIVILPSDVKYQAIRRDFNRMVWFNK
jgi:uncharacterized protein YigE (DUF2233 family)